MEIPRTRDVVVLVADLTYPVKVTSAMAQAGWPGGQGVVWSASPGADDFIATFSDGVPGGFLLWGSDEASDQLVSYVQNQSRYCFGVACVGSWVISTSSYEKYTLQSRLVPPLVENVYVPGTHVFFSLRGLLTSQDEWTVSGDSRAPNTHFAGTIIQAPDTFNNEYLMVQTAI